MQISQDQSSETSTPQDVAPAEELVQVQEAAEQDVQSLLDSAKAFYADALETLISVSTLYQLGAILLAVLLGWFMSRKPKSYFVGLKEKQDHGTILYRIYHAVQRVIFPICIVILLWLAMFAFRATGQPADILKIAASLTNAAIIVRLITGNMESGPLRSLITFVAWAVAALYILGWLQPVIATLENTGVTLGETRITVLQVILSFVLAIGALWLGRIIGDAAQTQLRASKRLPPSMSGLLGQVVKIGIMILAVFIALNSIGINMASLAVLSGAIGVGIGFGLQSIFSNFISGIIILFEKSVQVGDFIELQSGVRGQVKEINIRSTLVTTNDSVDILVPNEEFIKAQVINWTLRDPRRRLHVPFGVAYGVSKEDAQKAGLEAAEAVEWTVKAKGFEPAVWLVEFGDSSLNYELVVWLDDSAVKRPGRVVADYNWALHTALEKYGIEIPFPQRDLNIREGGEITVRMVEGKKK